MKPYSPVVLTPKIGMIDLYSDKKINKMNKNKITISPSLVGGFFNSSLMDKSIAKSIVISDITGKEIIRFQGNENSNW